MNCGPRQADYQLGDGKNHSNILNSEIKKREEFEMQNLFLFTFNWTFHSEMKSNEK